MSDFNKRQTNRIAATIDLEIVAFHVNAEDREDVAEYLLAAIVTKCIIEFNEAPEMLE